MSGFDRLYFQNTQAENDNDSLKFYQRYKCKLHNSGKIRNRQRFCAKFCRRYRLSPTFRNKP